MNNLLKAILVIAMITIIVMLDVTLFRSSRYTWERLAANFGIVLLLVSFYFRFVKHT